MLELDEQGVPIMPNIGDAIMRLGSHVVDCFGGVALGSLDAMVNGLQWTGIELEARFVSLGQANIAEWVRRYGHASGWGSARLLNGDSRRLCEVIGAADSIVGSPPFGERRDGQGIAIAGEACGRALGRSTLAEGADCVVGSPPFAESLMSGKLTIEDALVMARKTNEQYSQGRDEAGVRRQAELKLKSCGADYGHSPGQLGSMPAGSVDAVLSSPPYSSGTVHDGNSVQADKLTGNKPGRNSQALTMDAYGSTTGNLGNLRPGSVDSVVSSPPYEGSNQRYEDGWKYIDADKIVGGKGYRCKAQLVSDYGDTQGQLGNSTGETFWHAAREIVQQCHAILKPGGVAAWVTKDFVRNKARVPFSADWLKLCEACGFELVEWVHASLVKDLGKHADLYGDVHHKTVERKSFFRRLAEKKGSPRIDHEDVIFVRKVEQQGELFTA